MRHYILSRAEKTSVMIKKYKHIDFSKISGGKFLFNPEYREFMLTNTWKTLENYLVMQNKLSIVCPNLNISVITSEENVSPCICRINATVLKHAMPLRGPQSDPS